MQKAATFFTEKKKQWAENIHLPYKFQGTRKILCQQEKQEQESTFSLSQMGSVQPCLNTLPWQENSGIYTNFLLSTIEDTCAIESTLNALPTSHPENAKQPDSFILYLTRNHKEMQDIEAQKEGKTR